MGRRALGRDCWREGEKSRAKEKVPEVKKVMEEKERGKEALVERGKGKEALVEREKEKEAPVEREKEEREKEVIPTAQVKCHQLRISWLRHRILLQLRFVCSPPWDGLTVTW